MKIFLPPVRFRRRSSRRTLTLLAVAGLAAALAGCGSQSPSHPAASASALAQNPAVDPGSPLGNKAAPNFRLLDQFGRPVTLSQFHGKAVLIAFVDSHCTTICPLTTTSMLEAVHLLGRAGQQVRLIGINANPDATRVSDVHDYSAAHGMLSSWDFLTGSLDQLKQVWKDYHVYVQAIKGNIDHEPAIYLIRPDGREQSIFLTQMAYTGTDQQAQVLANATAAVLPGRPHVTQAVNLHYLPGTGPAVNAALPVVGGKSGGKTVMFGRGHPHLVVFFASWLNETSDLQSELTGLNEYVQTARAAGLPGVTAIDEESSEPSLATVRSYLASFHGALSYPVALDETGRLADGYQVQDQPWFVLTSASGAIRWHHDGWLPESQLVAAVRAAAG